MADETKFGRQPYADRTPTRGGKRRPTGESLPPIARSYVVDISTVSGLLVKK